MLCGCPVDSSALQSCPIGSGAAGMLFTSLVTSLLQSSCDLATEPRTYPREPHLPLTESYDFVIVGAGSAGTVMASRLSEDADRKVLLLEAGGDPSQSTEIPGLLGTLVQTDEDWQFTTVKRTSACLGFKESGKCLLPRGKSVGGCSNLYGMVYLRGNKCDYDSWARGGLIGWSYQDVLPYFKKSEDLRAETISSAPNSSTFHGTGGYCTVSHIKSNLSVYDALKEASREMGYDVLLDFCADKTLGFGEALGAIRDGERCSNAKAFLSPANHRENLHLLRHAYVTRIFIDPNKKQAYGVEISHRGRIITVNASKEVILSAGTVKSPQILMLSGVGPEDPLKSLGIEAIVVNNNVGANLRDHLKSPIVTYCINNETYYRDQLATTSDFNAYQYLSSRTGPLATLSYNNFLGLIRTNKTKDEYCPEGYPDTEMQMSGLNRTDKSGHLAFLRKAGYGEDVARAHNEIFDSCDVTIISYQTILHPRSTGTIMLRSSDPFEDPNIDPQYLTNDADIETLLAGVKVAIDFGNTEAMKKIGTEVKILELETCSEYKNTTKEYWECAIRQVASTIYHPVGTCKMGPLSDKSAVVDQNLRVIGVKNLRVVDASVMPHLPSGNIHAVVTMIAEKAADLVRETWRTKHCIDV